MRAVFLDRDGVLCENKPDHVKSWSEFRFLPGVRAGLTQLAATDLASVVVTNQAIINRGMVPADVVDNIHRRMMADVHLFGGRIDQVMVCPHRVDEQCNCRKPQPGLLLNAAREMGIDLAHSYLIGDAITDMQAGLSVGCTSIMVMTGRGSDQLQQMSGWLRAQIRVARDLQDALEIIFYLEAFAADHPALVQPVHPPLVRPLVTPALQGQAS